MRDPSFVAESSYEGHAFAPKTRASRCKVFVDTPLLRLCRGLVLQMPTRKASFSVRIVAQLSNPNNVRNRVLVSACKRAKIPQVSWHNFRYTYSAWANPSGD
jgi:hypothetical protein